MDNIFMISGIVAVIYFIAKFIETRYMDEETKPLKYLIRDTLLVYVSVVAGCFIIDQLNPVILPENMVPEQPLAFTDNPPF